jgi:hypothetical protein
MFLGAFSLVEGMEDYRVTDENMPASSHLDRPRLHTLLARVFTP